MRSTSSSRGRCFQDLYCALQWPNYIQLVPLTLTPTSQPLVHIDILLSHQSGGFFNVLRASPAVENLGAEMFLHSSMSMTTPSVAHKHYSQPFSVNHMDSHQGFILALNRDTRPMYLCHSNQPNNQSHFLPLATHVSQVLLISPATMYSFID